MGIEKAEAGRVAFRVEGENWVAYYAETNTMHEALELGRIKMSLVRDPETKARFMEAVTGGLAALTDGLITTFEDPAPAPERERSGRA